MKNDLYSVFKSLLISPGKFCQTITLRKYQLEIAEAICNSVIKNLGLSFVVMLPRQSGKNECQAQIEAYLLALLADASAEMVKISPTWKPQTETAMRRLEKTLKSNMLLHYLDWKREKGYMYRVESSRITFLSGSPETNIVGATASVLLEVDEAQDILITKYDKEVAPMAASANATRVFWGTAWTANTLLARELRASMAAQKKDNRQRVWRLTAEDVSKEVPAYRRHVNEQILKLGRQHPLVKSQYFSEEIDAQGGLFPDARISLMLGYHVAQQEPTKGNIYAFLIDVGGSSQADEMKTVREHDSTVLTVVQVDLSSLHDLSAPTYRAVHRTEWNNVAHPTQYAQIKALAELWQPRYLVVDSTGIGAGICGFLERKFKNKVLPFVFTPTSKSKLGYDFLAVIESGRFKEHNPADPIFIKQLQTAQYEILEGSAKTLRWSVPDNARDENGELVHDDYMLSAALCAVLDEQSWAVAAQPMLIQRADPLAEMDKGF